MRKSFCVVLLSLCAVSNLCAQVARADYERAKDLAAKYKTLALNMPGEPAWIEDTDTFWYRKTVEGGHAFVMIDAATQQKKSPFDHAKLASALSPVSGQKYTDVTLPFDRFEFADKQTAIQFVVERQHWRCVLANYTCSKESQEADDDGGYDDTPKPVNSEEHVMASPDGKWEALIQNYNVVIRPKGKSDKTVLSWDGSEGDYYALETLAWSPDSQHLAAFRIRPGFRREVHYVESSPDQLQPKYSSMVYPKAGDLLALPQPVLFQIASKKEIPIDNRLFPNPYELSRAVWWKDSRGFTFEYNQRGHQAYRVIEVDAASGAARTLIDEEAQTFFEYTPLEPNQFGTGKRYRHDVNDGKEILWLSERDGWAHLYLYDGATGKVKNQITKGEWVVRGVNYVDDTKRQIWFEAGGIEPGKDPYFSDVIEKFNVDAYFLDIVGGWQNNTKADSFEGTRLLVEELRRKYPHVAAVGEMHYDALMSCIPMYQVNSASLYHPGFHKYARAFEHLSRPAPGRGSTGVHEAGFGHFHPQVDPKQSAIPTITVVDDTFDKYRDLMLQVIQGAKARAAM